MTCTITISMYGTNVAHVLVIVKAMPTDKLVALVAKGSLSAHPGPVSTITPAPNVPWGVFLEKRLKAKNC